MNQGSIPLLHKLTALRFRNWWGRKAIQVGPIIQRPLQGVPRNSEEQVLPEDSPLVTPQLAISSLAVDPFRGWPSHWNLPWVAKIVRIPQPQIAQFLSVFVRPGRRRMVFHRNYIRALEVERGENPFTR